MCKKSERVFSGIQPSGEIHIGNYLGAIKKWVEISDLHDSIFCIVDDHAITVDYDPGQLPTLIFEAALTGMACGLDPDRCTLFVQSHVPEHTELTWLFNTVTPLGSLFRMTQFKEKSRNALQKAIGLETSKQDAKQDGIAQKSAAHQLLNTARAAEEMSREIAPLIGGIDPESLADDGAAARLNEILGEMMQHLQVGLGVSQASTALFDYPVLQAADILLYKATLVPVGEDQEQHLELCREIADRFNRRFGPIFPMAKRIPGEAPRIIGLDGRQKMSKSLDNQIGMLASPDEIKKRLSRAFTDPQRKRRSDPGRPEVCNIFSLHGHFTAQGKREELAVGCRTAGIGCFECKEILAAGIIEELAPIQSRAADLRKRPNQVQEALERGRARCKEIASETMDEVRSAAGIGRSALNRLVK